ncbi:MAG: hypothetical protein LAT76_12520, partial [Schleiferiaceae bacterium]|nr:hypothetical protein [Schleiferiaceae bacterium]
QHSQLLANNDYGWKVSFYAKLDKHHILQVKNVLLLRNCKTTSEVMKVYYGEKLFDDKWKQKRDEILSRDGKKCVICGKSEGKLHVHHKQYHFIKRLQRHVDPWDYDDKYLITLCESCHSRGHSKFKVPVKYI